VFRFSREGRSLKIKTVGASPAFPWHGEPGFPEVSPPPSTNWAGSRIWALGLGRSVCADQETSPCLALNRGPAWGGNPARERGKRILAAQSSWFGFCGQRCRPWWGYHNLLKASRGGNPPAFKHRRDPPSPTAPNH